METAGKEVDDAELREAMKDSGIGTPATRASIIERLVDVGYIEREGRALHATEKGVMVIRLLDSHPLTSPALTGDWESRLGKIEQGGDSRPAFMKDIAQFAHRDGRAARQAQGREDRAAKPRALPGLRPRRDREPQGLLVLVARGPRLRLRDLEEEGGQEPAAVGGQGADGLAAAPHARPARTPASGAPPSRSPASRAAPAAPSAPSCGSSRPRKASGGSSSTRTGPRSRRRARPTARRPTGRRSPTRRRRPTATPRPRRPKPLPSGQKPETSS